MNKETEVFCSACGWAKQYYEIPTNEELLEVMDNNCPDCGGVLFVKGKMRGKDD